MLELKADDLFMEPSHCMSQATQLIVKAGQLEVEQVKLTRFGDIVGLVRLSLLCRCT